MEQDLRNINWHQFHWWMKKEEYRVVCSAVQILTNTQLIETICIPSTNTVLDIGSKLDTTHRKQPEACLRVRKQTHSKISVNSDLWPDGDWQVVCRAYSQRTMFGVWMDVWPLVWPLVMPWQLLYPMLHWRKCWQKYDRRHTQRYY